MSSCDDKILDFCRLCGVAAPDSFLVRMEELRSLLVEANEKTNLTRITSPDEFLNKHVADSVSLALAIPAVATEPLAVADLGCGAGFPSIPLALAFPCLRVTAIDSNHKKMDFVAHVALRMKITNLAVLRGRARELARKEELKGVFDLVVSRAVGPPADVFIEGRQMLVPAGRIVVFRSGEDNSAELAEAEKVSARYDFKWQATSVFQLPLGGGRRFVVGGSRL